MNMLIKRFVLPIVAAVAIIIGCVIYLNYDPSINHGEDNIVYNGIEYERTILDYNLTISEENSEYVGEFSQIYEYGQEVLYEVRVLNSEANLLYSLHADWIKPGYSQPSPYGEEFTLAEYVVSEGIEFKTIPDDYTEEVTLLANFKDSVKLEDIIETEASKLNLTAENIHECDKIRFKYKNHTDISLSLYIYSVDGQYYLDVRHPKNGTHEWFKIKPEYVDVLTSAMPKT